MQQRWWTVLRATGLLVACVLAGSGAWLLTDDLLRPVASALVPRTGPGLGEVSFEQALDAVCAAVLLGCVLWLALGTALAVVAQLAAELSPASSAATVLGSLTDRGCPRVVRRLVTAVLGAAVGAGAAGAAPALADVPGSADPGGAHHTTSTHGVSGLAVPDRTTGPGPGPGHDGPPSGTGPARPVRAVLVRAGDSLWSIAADLLPRTASDRDVTEAWHRLHRANVAEVGPDPDLILPGTRLEVPATVTTHHREEPS